ncbi:hypothetical protein ACH4L5_36825 [Streptomyces sp. NPDC017405]|uniref:hypothetical protein n=1 Tax=unclassified Streptomyces TaxID=2593676 RepID=UPI0037965589
MNTGFFVILASLAPIIAPLWGVATGLFCIRIGRKARSPRRGWFLFLMLGLLPVGGLFAALGLIAAVGVVAAIGGLIVFLIYLDWHGGRLPGGDSNHE